MKAQTLPLIHLNDAQSLPAIDLLQKTFFVDAGMRDICRGNSDSVYRQRLRHWFAATLQMNLQTQQSVWGLEANGRLCAIAILTDSDKKRTAKAMLQWTITVGRSCGLNTVRRTIDQDHRRRPFLPDAAHTILEFIAVDPDWQGKGIARQLFNTIHQQAQTKKKVMWLETTRPHNVPIFEHFGYNLIDQNQKNGVDYFFMIHYATEDA